MIKVLELFSGYGGASFGLTKANIKHETIGYSDIEKCANYIYALNHGEDIPQMNDVTKIDETKLEDFDLLTGGFPCQSFSIAGKREGFKAEKKGQLFFDIIRIAEHKKPRYMLLENVEGIISHDNGKTLRVILQTLKEIGYVVKWKKMYSRDHNTPQNRPRVWFACFRESEDAKKFMFPEKEKLIRTVKDLLEDEVDKKYYLTQNQLLKLGTYYKQTDNMKICNTITAEDTKKRAIDMPIIADYRYDECLRPRKDGIAPTLCSSKRDGNGMSGMPIIMNMQKRSENRPSIQKAIKEGKTLPGGVGILTRTDGISYTIDTSANIAVNTNQWRRLTPKECFRLMGFFNDEIKFGHLSDSRLYFLAGNGWDINVAAKIFKQMFIGNQNQQKGLGNWFADKE